TGSSRSRQAWRVQDGQSRSGKGALVHRRAGGQENQSHSRRLVRCLGRRDLRNRSGRRPDDSPVVRAPNGVVQDSAEFFGAGKPYYDPAKITVPTLLVGAEWDRDTPPYMAQTLF